MSWRLSEFTSRSDARKVAVGFSPRGAGEVHLGVAERRWQSFFFNAQFIFINGVPNWKTGSLCPESPLRPTGHRNFYYAPD